MIRGALEGLPHVEKKGVRQIADDRFEVIYDPEKTGFDDFDFTLREIGYLPSLAKGVAARLTTRSLDLQSRAQGVTHPRGEKGKLVVGLFVTQGHRLGGEGLAPTIVEVKGPAGVTFEVSRRELAGALNSKQRTVFPLEFRVSPEAKAGDHTIEVKVTFQAHRGGETAQPETARVLVPLTID